VLQLILTGRALAFAGAAGCWTLWCPHATFGTIANALDNTPGREYSQLGNLTTPHTVPGTTSTSFALDIAFFAKK
jgi:hypothetical protein